MKVELSLQAWASRAWRWSLCSLGLNGRVDYGVDLFLRNAPRVRGVHQRMWGAESVGAFVFLLINIIITYNSDFLPAYPG